MNVKIDTKQKFSVLTPQQPDVSANMTEAMEKLADYATKEVPHLVINMSQVKEIDRKSTRLNSSHSSPSRMPSSA